MRNQVNFMDDIPVEAQCDNPNENNCVFPNAQPCGARTRRGTACRAPAVLNIQTGRRTRCRRHGGLSTGPRSPMIKHGRYSKAVKAIQRAMLDKLEELREGASAVSHEGTT